MEKAPIAGNVFSQWTMCYNGVFYFAIKPQIDFAPTSKNKTHLKNTNAGGCFSLV